MPLSLSLHPRHVWARKIFTVLLTLLLGSAPGGILLIPENSSAAPLENEPIQPLEIPKNLPPDKVKLGQKLFNDPRLSKDDSIACASCHMAEQGGAVHLPFAPEGVSGKAVKINVPTFFGAHLNFAQFWDGRAETLEKQIDGPVTNPDEMGTSWDEVVGKLSKDAEYTALFKKIYNGPPTPEHIKDAIAVFERSQVPVDSPFDMYLKGDKNVLSKEALAGYDLFKNLGCISCHQGQSVGGNMFQKFGVLGDYFKDRGGITDKDMGRFNVTKQEEDRHVFKVPSLRNVELTAPYFHDGSAADLGKAVDVMARYQLGRNLSVEERNNLVAFLKSLTGKMRKPE
jgi:cytochrome c peroxidase